MSNIIDFRKSRKKTGQIVSGFISQTEYFWKELDDKRMLLDVVMENAAEEFQQRGYPIFPIPEAKPAVEKVIEKIMRYEQ